MGEMPSSWSNKKVWYALWFHHEPPIRIHDCKIRPLPLTFPSSLFFGVPCRLWSSITHSRIQVGQQRPFLSTVSTPRKVPTLPGNSFLLSSKIHKVWHVTSRNRPFFAVMEGKSCANLYKLLILRVDQLEGMHHLHLSIALLDMTSDLRIPIDKLTFLDTEQKAGQMSGKALHYQLLLELLQVVFQWHR